MKLNLEAAIGKFKLPAPIICASGTFGFGDELKGLVDFRSIGAFITKTITLEPRAGNPAPRIYETEEGVLNSVGLENPGLDVFIKDKLPKIRKLKIKFIVSIGGFSRGDYKTAVKTLEKQPIDAFEINLSCPNLKLKKIISQDAKLTFELVKELRAITDKALIIKITPEVSDITKIAKAVERAGADALSLVNTFFGMSIDIEAKKPRLGNIYGGYSGRAIKPMALYRVWRAAQAVRIPIVGGGGIENAADAIEFFLAGAAAVSIGTVNFVYPDISRKILSGIKQYLAKNKINSITNLIKKGRIDEDG